MECTRRWTSFPFAWISFWLLFCNPFMSIHFESMTARCIQIRRCAGNGEQAFTMYTDMCRYARRREAPRWVSGRVFSCTEMMHANSPGNYDAALDEWSAECAVLAGFRIMVWCVGSGTWEWSCSGAVSARIRPTSIHRQGSIHACKICKCLVFLRGWEGGALYG